MDIFTYEYCKQLLVYTCTGILIGGCVIWYVYLIVQILTKAVKQAVRFVKWIKAKRHPAEEIQSTENQ